MAMSVALSFAQNERYFANGYREDEFTDSLRVANILVSFGEIAILGRYYRLLNAHDRQVNSGQIHEYHPYTFSLELGVHLLLLPPRVNSEPKFYLLGTYTVISLSDFLFLLTLLRLYQLPRFAYWCLQFNSRRAYFHA